MPLIHLRFLPLTSHPSLSLPFSLPLFFSLYPSLSSLSASPPPPCPRLPLRPPPPPAPSSTVSALLISALLVSALLTRSTQVKLRGLPYGANMADVVNFFRGFGVIDGTVTFGVNADGRPSGEAWVSFGRLEDARRAVREKDRWRPPLWLRLM